MAKLKSALALGLLAAAAAVSQIVTGSLEGTVKDSQGGLIPDAAIQIRAVDTGSARASKAGGAGVFRFDSLDIGNYEVVVTKAGFKRYTTTVPVTLGNAAAVNIVMEIGDVTESVRVEAGAALVEANTAEISRSVSTQQMTELPVLSRNPAELLQLSPGVPAVTQDKNGSLTVGGMRPRSTTYNVDGSSNNFEVSSGPRTPVILEAVEQVRAVTNVFSAQYGKGSGAVVDMVLRSGTNQFHGDLFEYLRNKNLDATPFFNNATGTGKPPFSLNIYGATIGGPIIKNRTFFFAAFQGTNLRTQAIERATLPVASLRTPLLDNPLTLATDPKVAALITSAFARIPVCTGPGTTCVFSSNQGRPTDEYIGNLKVDHRLTDRDLFSFRYLIRDLVGSANSALADVSQTQENRDTNLAITYRRIFTPTVLNELVFARSYFKRAVLVADTNLPDVQISGLVSIGAPSNLPQAFDNTYYQVVDNFSVTRGSHFIKAGVDALFNTASGFAKFSSRGIYAFGPLPAGQGAADALTNFRLGRSSQFTQTQGDFVRRFDNWDTSFYVQDDWRILPNLTLNLGLRYDIQLPPSVTAVSNGQTVFEAFDPSTFNYSHWKTDRNNFGPSIGFAWSPAKSGRTAVRGGYRRAYDRAVQDLYNIGSIQQAPFIQTLSVALPQVPAIPLGGGPALAKDAGIPVSTMLRPDFQLSYGHAWQVSVQERIGANSTLEVGYLGTAGRDLSVIEGRNRIDPLTKRRPNAAFGSINVVGSLGYSNYHGLLTNFRYRARRGLSLTAAYTWSKALDIVHDPVAGFGGASAAAAVANEPITQTPYLDLDYGPAIFDRRHAFSMSVLQQTPKFLKNPIAGAVLNSWNVSGIILVQSGNPFTVLAGADLNQDGVANDRPDLVNPSLLTSNKFDNVNQLLPRAAFNGALTSVRIGTLGRNTFLRDGVANVDLSVVKQFPVWNERRLEFRAEFFNLFNHVRFGPPVTNLAAANFGTILSQENSPRFIRFGLRFRF